MVEFQIPTILNFLNFFFRLIHDKGTSVIEAALENRDEEEIIGNFWQKSSGIRIPYYSGGLNTKHWNTKHIGIPNILKVGFPIQDMT